MRLAREAARRWRRGGLAHAFDVAMPDAPARPDKPELLPPNRMPRCGKGGSARGRVALLHALAHIEFSAIDLAFDMAGRFGAEFPRAFVDDWLSVGADEATLFAILERRSRTPGSAYGELPAYAGLWEAAEATAADVVGRLAVMPMVLEARGLDVTPETVAHLRSVGDESSARILHRIYTDEIRHVGMGVRWFGARAAQAGVEPAPLWREKVWRYFQGGIKPPFNDSARDQAGLTREVYRLIAC